MEIEVQLLVCNVNELKNKLEQVQMKPSSVK